MPKPANVRAAAARILESLLAGKGSLTSNLNRYRDHPESPLLKEICFGCCRYYPVLQAMVDGQLEKPLRSKDSDIYSLLIVGAYQIFLMRIPDHAAVNESVQATRALKKPWARGLVNGLMRRLLEKRGQWSDLLSSERLELRYLHPGWLIEALQQDWPDHWQHLLAANNQRAPMCLRVCLPRIGRADYLESLEDRGLKASPGGLAPTAVYLENPVSVELLPGFREGWVSVQDEASQLIPGILDLSPGHSVLDACAAPGGKTCHILESEQSLSRLLALEIDESRLSSIKENLQRLQLNAQLQAVDASQLDRWWDDNPFDRILLDAPCSATGVIRRHPDIKLLRRPRDISLLVDRQLHLLTSLWRCLAPGGRLLYTTCSVLKAENDGVIKRFLGSREDAKYQAIAADWGLKCEYGRQLLPEDKGSDGFYYALLEKRPVGLSKLP